MQKLKYMILLASLSIFFGACPYESTVPIDSPQIRIDSQLLGDWKDSKDEKELYQIKSLDSFIYEIIKYNKDERGETKYNAYISVINTTKFLNLWEIKSDQSNSTYNLYKIEKMDSKLLIISEVTENIIEKFTTSEALKIFINENMHHSFFYNKEKMKLIHY